MIKIEIQKDYYSIEQCKLNPDKLYIFGDNLIQKGKGGQAQIRDCDNTFGLPTKKLPTMKEDAFFNDDTDDTFGLISSFRELIQLTDDYERCGITTIVFPKDGLGTGLAMMPVESPVLFGVLCRLLFTTFGVKMTKDGFIE